jgi:NTE family protein
MRWNLMAGLPLLLALGCGPTRFECKDPAPTAEPDLEQEQCFSEPVPSFDFENLAIEGGGAKGVAYGGAVVALHQAGVLQKLKRVAGTSAGSISAGLIALGYTPEELHTTLMNLDLAKFKDDGSVFRLVGQFGYYSGEYYLSWAQCQVARKTGDANTTFQQLHERNQKQSLPDLYIITTDLTHARWEVLSHETVPCMPVALAMRLSGSLPFFFDALRLDLKRFKHRPDGTCRAPGELGSDKDGDVFSDGGVLFNYPLALFDTEIVDGKPVERINFKSMGLHLDSRSDDRKNLTINDLPQYAQAVATTLLQSQVDYFEHSPCDQARTARINDLGVSTEDFNLSRAEKLALIRSGFKGTCEYLKSWTPQSVQNACEGARPSRTVARSSRP